MQVLQPIIDILKMVLEFLNTFLHNYGLSIVVLSVLTKVVLLPLTIKQTKSTKAMQELQPKLKELQAKYKDDKERLNKEMMSFYSENKVNPLSGCLPLLLQLPIMFALFRMLTDPVFVSKVLSKESFLWIGNLSKPDLVLVAFMVITTYLSQAMVAKDPQQKSMMLPMTFLMGFISFSFPAGVLLYWVTSNLATIAQQYFQLKDTPGSAVIMSTNQSSEIKTKPQNENENKSSRNSRRK